MTTFSRHHLTEVVTYNALRAAGMTHSAIRHAVASGRLHPRHRGVYAVGRPQLSQLGVWYAAVLACGDDAALSHASAGTLQALTERGGEWPHVSVPTDHGRRRASGLTIHRTASLMPTDVTVVAGIRVTTVERTLIDLARTTDRRALRAAVRQAERLHRIDLVALRERVAQPRTNIAHARLFRLLSAYVPGSGLTDSELEARFLELCVRARLPMPERQVAIGPYRVDFLWRNARIVVEMDGRATHDTAMAFAEDRSRDRALAAAGYLVLRFTWAEVVYHAAAVAAELLAAVGRRQPPPAGNGARRSPKRP